MSAKQTGSARNKIGINVVFVGEKERKGEREKEGRKEGKERRKKEGKRKNFSITAHVMYCFILLTF